MRGHPLEALILALSFGLVQQHTVELRAHTRI